MSRDSAAVVAQVVPVITFALALNLRSVAVAFGKERIRAFDREAVWALYPVFIQAITLTVLAVVECEVLAVAISDGPGPGWFWALEVGIVVTFLTPVLDAATRVAQGFPDTEQGRLAAKVLIKAVSGLFAAVLLTVLVAV